MTDVLVERTQEWHVRRTDRALLRPLWLCPHITGRFPWRRVWRALSLIAVNFPGRHVPCPAVPACDVPGWTLYTDGSGDDTIGVPEAESA